MVLQLAMIKSIKYRCYPTSEQKTALERSFGSVRWLWNYLLSKRKDHFKQTGKGLSQFECNNLLPALKREVDWLKETHSQTLQYVSKNLQQAYTNFFQKRAAYPKFKSKKYSKKYSKKSLWFPQGVQRSECAIFIPKTGWIKTNFHREFVGDIKVATVRKHANGKYFISLTYEDSIPTPLPSIEGKGVGIDMNLKDYVVDSDGNTYKNPKYLKKHERNLARKQKQLDRRQEGSKNREKKRIQVATIHDRIVNCRVDYQHKLSRKIVDENQVICLETLNIAGMKRNKKLSKSISDASWFRFMSQLRYKAEWSGKVVVQIDRFYPSSALCNCCGHKKEDMTLSVREWRCPSCNALHDRDGNAARNIFKEGMSILETSFGTSDAAYGGGVSPQGVSLPVAPA